MVERGVTVATPNIFMLPYNLATYPKVLNKTCFIFVHADYNRGFL